jgi:hypothetical protein
MQIVPALFHKKHAATFGTVYHRFFNFPNVSQAFLPFCRKSVVASLFFYRERAGAAGE